MNSREDDRSVAGGFARAPPLRTPGGEIFSDDIVAAAMIDRLVHHAEVLTLAGDSYRTRTRRELLNTPPTPGTDPEGSTFADEKGRSSAVVDRSA